MQEGFENRVTTYGNSANPKRHVIQPFVMRKFQNSKVQILYFSTDAKELNSDSERVLELYYYLAKISRSGLKQKQVERVNKKPDILTADRLHFKK